MSSRPEPRRLRRLCAAVLIVCVFAAACSSNGDNTTDARDDPAPTADTQPGDDGEGDSTAADGAAGDSTAEDGASGDSDDGSEQGAAMTVSIEPGVRQSDTTVTLDLRDGSADVDSAVVANRTVDGAALDDRARAALLNRLEPLGADDGDQVDFARPVDTRPPPRPLEIVEADFPPPPTDQASAESDAGPLEVLRYQPEGEVDVAPFISITFNKPMVAVSTVDQLETVDVPVMVDPPIEGRWLWLGTRTLRFEQTSDELDRLPKATEFVVTIPAGVEADDGSQLAEAVEFEFSTPTAELTSVWPLNEFLDTETLFLLEFNQRIDPAEAIRAIGVDVEGKPVAVRLATAAEIAEDPELERRIARRLDDRLLVMRATEPLAVDSRITIVADAIPSAEGPLRGGRQDFDGRTYGRFEFRQYRCPWGDDCPPGTDVHLEFTNPIDAEAFDASLVSIEPALPGADIGVQSSALIVRGQTVGRTEYTITVAEGLRDEFGQTLAEAVEITFTIGDAQPALLLPGTNLVTLDPIVDDATFTVSSINHRELDLLVYEVDPTADWITFQENSWQLGTDQVLVDWPVLSDTTIEPPGDANAWVQTPIDLREQLTGSGHVVVVITPSAEAQLEEWQRQPLSLWVQRTDLGIDAFSTEFDRLIRVTSLSTGEAIDGASVVAVGEGGRARAALQTDSDGIVTNDDRGLARTIIASYGDDQAILGDFWSQLSPPVDRTLWYVTDDRGIYKPGETARLKGFVRIASATEPAALRLPESSDSYRWVARDEFGNEFDQGTIDLGDLASFDLAIAIPDDIALGQAGIEFTTGRTNNPGAFHYHALLVQEFRRPDFEVSVEALTTGPYLANEAAQLLAQANYFATGPLAGADVEWFVRATSGSYAPPGWSDYTFGIWQPWWLRSFPGQFLKNASFDATSDATGEHTLELNLSLDGTPRPVALSVSATVLDVDRQPINGRTDLLVHPSSLYIGLRSERSFVRSGEDLTIEAIATTIDGEIVADHDMSVELIRNTWEFTNGSWAQGEELTDACEVVSTAEPVSCTFQPELGGSYRVVATITDDTGRTNRTELTRWVAGESRPASQRVAREDVTIIPQDELFAPGNTAELLVQSPFADAHGLLILTRGSISSHEPISFDGSGAAVVSVPISASDIPVLGVHVEVVGTAPRGESVRPAYASGQLTLEVSSESRRLKVQAIPLTDLLAPGASTSLDVTVTNAAGDPVADAELAVIVVDEAVLSLTDFELQDPLEAFYQRSGGWLQAKRGRSSLILSSPSTDTKTASNEDNAGGFAAPQAEAMADDGGTTASARSQGAPQMALTGAPPAQPQAIDTPIELRSRFDALAVFEPDVVTDAAGRATVEVPLPDNLTRYRIMVIAAADAQLAGTGESNLTARLPISVRPTAPRFANFGDEFEFPFVVQNATDEDREVDVALRATNLNLADRSAVTITVPANDRVEVRFAASADQAGTARYQVVAASGDLSDAAEGAFPVYTPATSEAFATYGVVDDGSVGQNVAAPADVFPQFGGLEISTSSTAVASLTDAVISLRDHPYQNADALASRIIAIISLDSILAAFESPELSAADLNSTVNGDIERLLTLQNADGGFNWWRRNGPSIPWVTITATHALVLADQDGRDVTADKLAAALDLLSRIETIFPPWYDEETKTAIRAYAIHVENLAGRDVSRRAVELYRDNNDDLSPDVAAWLWPALTNETEISAEIERQLNNRVTETANAATFATSYDEQAWLLLHSDRRTDAVVLNALLDQAPDSDLVVKTLNGLLAARGQRGAWRNVQENSWILIAAGRYFDEFEVTDPSFVARAWLGDTYALEHDHLARRTEQDRTIVPMTEVIDGGDRQLVIDKDGDGRLYYRIGLRYAPTDLMLEPRDRGFVVQRSYEAVDDENDVTQNDDGSWSIAAGARVRVKLSMVADSRRTHVALIDPLPAGLEAINPALATSEPLPNDPGDNAAPFSSWFNWFNHQNLRDDRAEAFSTWLGAGTYEYTYVARATIPGTFVVPPARAEQLYEPEIFGRSASTMVTVVDG